MDGRKFLEKFTSIYHNFEQPSPSLNNDYFTTIKNQTKSKISINMMQLINTAVSCLEEGEIYCEIGSYPGGSLIAALLNNNTMAYAIDPVLETDQGEQKLAELSENLRQFHLNEQVCLCQENVVTFFQDLQELECEDKIGVFYYDAVTDYRTVLKALMLVKPFLADEAFLIISHINKTEVDQAIEDFKLYHSVEQIHELLKVNSKHKLFLKMEQEFVILLWQNNNLNLRAKRINKQGLIKLNSAANQEKNSLLHVGCGPWRAEALPEEFTTEKWVEIRLDIDPNVKPDLMGSITNLNIVPDQSINAVYSSHNLEHIYNFEVPIALAEFKRVLKPEGFIMLVVPDMQRAAEWVIKGEMEQPPMYDSPAGPVSALWMFYGMGTSYPNMPYMAHKTGFTVNNLREKLAQAGFINIQIFRTSFNIIAYGYK